ncbi:BTB/POZ domain-containing protein [Drosera capensis]
MRVSGKDLFDPTTDTYIDATTNQKKPRRRGDKDEKDKEIEESNFGFAFNDSNFSDRVLRIEIMAGSKEEMMAGWEGGGGVCGSVSDWVRDRKRRRDDLKKDVDGSEFVGNSLSVIARGTYVIVCPEEQILNQPDTDDVLGYENDEDEVVAVSEEALSGDEPDNSNDSSWSMDCSLPLRVTALHISSPILAAKSPFFYKLFSNGMIESEQRHVTLRINESEEAALMELLNFMYTNTLSATTAPDVLNVLMAADKFEVASCMRHCCWLLRSMPMTPESALLYLELPSSILMGEAVQPLTDAAKQYLVNRYKDITKSMPMTPESALLYLELPSSILMGEAVQPLTDAAKQYLVNRYKDITKSQDELMSLPISIIEALLSTDDLQVASEDAVYDFILKWARTQYPKLEERREILSTRLIRFIRFPYMTCRKLKKVLSCPEFDNDVATKVVLEAVFFKAEAPHRQRAIAAEESPATGRSFMERGYKYRPIKLVEFDKPRPQCVVYLDLKKEECVNLFPTGREKGSVSFAVDYEFAARQNPSEDFVSKYKGNYTFTGGKAVGYRNLFGLSWKSFMADDSPYFINGVLHLRAELTELLVT